MQQWSTLIYKANRNRAEGGDSITITAGDFNTLVQLHIDYYDTVTYNKKYIFGHYTQSWHRAPKTRRIS